MGTADLCRLRLIGDRVVGDQAERHAGDSGAADRIGLRPGCPRLTLMDVLATQAARLAGTLKT